MLAPFTLGMFGYCIITPKQSLFDDLFQIPMIFLPLKPGFTKIIVRPLLKQLPHVAIAYDIKKT
jgi:hypothetical protein